MRIIITILSVVALCLFGLGFYRLNQSLNDHLKTDSLRRTRLIELTHETIILRDFLQKTNNITRDCYKCRKKVLFELSEDFEKFEILTNKPTTK